MFALRRSLAIIFGLALLSSSIAIEGAHAYQAAPSPIDQPFPPELRRPFAQFIRELGIKNAETLLPNVKATTLDCFFTNSTYCVPSAWLLRIEDKSACVDEVCLTIVGRTVGNRFESQFMLLAGKWYQREDSKICFLGQSLPPLVRLWQTKDANDKHPVTLIETAKGWIVTAPLK